MSGTTAGTVSGAVLARPYRVGQLIEHAYRRAGVPPQEITGERLQVALDLLFTMLSEYVNAGFPLWTRRFLYLPIKLGSADAPAPYGTVDVLSVYWTQFMPYRGVCETSSGGENTTLFGGAASDDVTITGATPSVTVAFGSTTEVDTVGVLLGGGSNLTAALTLSGSDDGTTFTTLKTLSSTTFQPGVWSYFEIDPSITTPYLRLTCPTTPWVLNQVNFNLANSTTTAIGTENIDDYYNMPNRQMRGARPNLSFVDRQRDTPVVKIWPTPNPQAFYNGTISVLARRYIDDPGLLTDTLEIPARWFEGVTARLAVRVMDELPPFDMTMNPEVAKLVMSERAARRQTNEGAATKAEALMWAEETSKGPMRIIPDIGAYTR